MTEFTLRPFSPDDAKELHRLREQSLEECPEAYSMGLEKWRGAPVTSVAAMIEASASGQDGPLVGVFQNETLLGFVGVKVIGRQKVAHVGTLWGLYVDPAHRRNGLGEQLIQRVLEMAKSVQSLEQVRLMVSTQSKAAVALFEKLDFQEYGVEPRGRKIDDHYHDLAYMWRRL